jgi:hypothetical protein
MKVVTDMFDIVLLFVLLGLMLPFKFGAIGPLIDMELWGFEAIDDKTMKFHGGDVLTLGELYADDSMTAAEIVLLTRVHNRDTVSPNRYMLPSGEIITVDGDYPVLMDEATITAQMSLYPTWRYRLVYDYEAGLWIFE